MKIGYGRVSTLDRNPIAQEDALRAAGCERIFNEQRSSQKARPKLADANSHLRAVDTLVVWKMDRLARSTLEVAQMAEDFKALTVGKIADTLGVSSTTLYRQFPKARAMQQ